MAAQPDLVHKAPVVRVAPSPSKVTPGVSAGGSAPVALISKDKLAYFKDNVADSAEDFDPTEYYYHRDRELLAAAQQAPSVTAASLVGGGAGAGMPPLMVRERARAARHGASCIPCFRAASAGPAKNRSSPTAEASCPHQQFLAQPRTLSSNNRSNNRRSNSIPPPPHHRHQRMGWANRSFHQVH
jgi:hypothetical protein